MVNSLMLTNTDHTHLLFKIFDCTSNLSVFVKLLNTQFKLFSFTLYFHRYMLSLKSYIIPIVVSKMHINETILFFL